MIPARFTRYLHSRSQVCFQGTAIHSNSTAVRVEDRLWFLCSF